MVDRTSTPLNLPEVSSVIPQATQAASGVAQGVAMGRDSQMAAAIQKAGTGIGNLFRWGQQEIQRRRASAYLDGYTDELKGENNEQDYGFFTQGTYQQGQGAMSATAAVQDFQRRAVEGFRDGITSGLTPDEYLDSLKPEMNDVLSDTQNGRWALTEEDRQRTVLGMQSTLQAVGKSYNQQFIAYQHTQAVKAQYTDVNGRVNSALAVQDDPKAFSDQVQGILGSTVSNKALTDDERESILTNGLGALLQSANLNVGNRAMIGQQVTEQLLKDPSMQSASPETKTRMLTAIDKYIKEGTKLDVAKMTMAMDNAETNAAQGKFTDLTPLEGYVQAAWRNAQMGTMDAETVTMLNNKLNSVRTTMYRYGTVQAKEALKGASGILTADQSKDQRNLALVGVAPEEKAQANVEYSLRAIPTAARAAQPAMVKEAQDQLADQIGILTNVDQSTFQNAVTEDPRYAVPFVRLFSAVKEEYIKGNNGQPNSLQSIVSAMDQQTQGALRMAIQQTQTGDAKDAIFRYMQLRDQARKGLVSLTFSPDSKEVQGALLDGPAAEKEFHNWFGNAAATFQKAVGITWVKGLFNSVDEDRRIGMFQQAQTQAFQRAQITSLQRDYEQNGGLGIGLDLRKQSVRNINANQLAEGHDFRILPWDASVNVSLPTLTKLDQGQKGEAIESIVKQGLGEHKLLPGDVLGLELRPDGGVVSVYAYTKRSDAPARVAMFDDSKVKAWHQEHIGEQAKRGVVGGKGNGMLEPRVQTDTKTGQPMKFTVSGYNNVEVDQTEQIALAKSLMRYEGFTTTEYDDPVRGRNIGAGFSNTAGAGSLYEKALAIPANRRTGQALVDLMMNDPEGLQGYQKRYVRPASEAAGLSWDDQTQNGKAAREMLTNMAWQRPADVGTANKPGPVVDIIRRGRAEGNWSINKIKQELGTLPSYQQAHPDRKRMYEQTMSQVVRGRV